MGHQFATSCPLPQPFTSASSLLAKISPEAVVGSFQMTDGYFLILATAQVLPLPVNVKPIQLLNCDFVTGQFEKNNQHYLIVETDQATHQTYTADAPPGSALPQAQLDLLQTLTARELQIATLIAHGWSNKQAAAHLAISEWTVATHLRRIFMKLQVDSRAAMVYKCAGLIQQTLS
jgi:DNA-binding CsgD family transcriptional regulator